MSRTLYDALLDASPAATPEEDLVRAFAQSGRHHRAAHDLATAEMLEGTYVQDLLDESEVRLAADDRSEVDRTLSAGPYTVQVQWSPAGLYSATQLSGPAGATLVIDKQFLPLMPGTAVDLPVPVMPESLSLMDMKGKTHILR
jgi:hypothetical protein